MLKKIWYNGGITYLLSFGLFILSMLIPILEIVLGLTIAGIIFMVRGIGFYCFSFIY